ncbi:MAG: methionine--tRNA ligase [Pseudomonadota bacterium]|nr:methionine--tRNA ligase [Pseudomonadota bacterium]
MTNRRIFVTSALPYANGEIHIGHLVEYIQADVWVRFQKLRGINCKFICASDAHGTPIMLKSDNLGCTPESLIKNVAKDQLEDFKKFNINFDNFHTTHSKENEQIVAEIFKALSNNGDIYESDVQQFYDPIKKIFLPDRYVIGVCPKCGAKDQYGDGCEKCGAFYSSIELKDPRSILSGSRPDIANSTHIFFSLKKYENKLKKWLNNSMISRPIKNKLKEWFDSGLQDWDISRDAPYFGFKIPGYQNKFFYVWLDAPIGYFASLKNYLEKNQKGSEYDSYVREQSTSEMYHFIGKDIMYFHSLFWPAVLMGSQHRLPDNIFVHGFLTINGEKMSKSKGTFITAKDYLRYLDPEHLRFYFSSRLGPSSADIDLNFEDYRFRINSDLIGKFINIGSRCSSFIAKYYKGRLSNEMVNDQHLIKIIEARSDVEKLYEDREFAKLIRLISGLCDDVNYFIDENKPWLLTKREDQRLHLHNVVSMGLFSFRILAIYLTPIIPEITSKIAKFFNEETLLWSNITNHPRGSKVNNFKNLSSRIEEENIKNLFKEVQSVNEPIVEKKENETVSIDDFLKIELKIGKILEAREIEDSKKLLKLVIDLGSEQRTIIAGIKNSYEPDEILNKHVICVSNLKARKMRFGTSEGMLLGASKEGDDNVFLLSVDPGATPGMIVK